MPTNLPPEYFEAERKFRAAESTSAKIECLENLISTIPKHKGTDHLRANLRRKLSKLKAEKHQKKSVSRHDSEYHIEHEGAARVVVVGPANTGKSSLLAKFTHATPKVSEFPFSTWGPTPGMMQLLDTQIQLIDTPPLAEDTVKPELFDLIRTADLVLLVIDLQAQSLRQFEESLAILAKHKIYSDQQKKPESEIASPSYMPFLIVANKCDTVRLDEDFAVFTELIGSTWSIVPLSLTTLRHQETFFKICFNNLQLIRIYSKPPGKEPDLTQPYVLKRGATLADFAAKVHRDFIEQLKNARVWGTKVFEGQLVSRDYILEDGDVVELHI
jgi:ribosome-interacting GTPase 1